MTPFSENEMKRLKWINVAPARFELRADKEVLATLEWPRPTSVHAHGRTTHGIWDLRRLSLFGPYVQVTSLDSGAEVAHFGKGSLEEPCTVKFHDGHTYYWRPLVMVEGMSFETLEGKPVVDIRPYQRENQHSANVSIYKRGSHLPILLLLGMYLLEMEYREDTSEPSPEEKLLTLQGT